MTIFVCNLIFVVQRVISVFITIRRASEIPLESSFPLVNLSGPSLSKVGDNEICLFNMRWIALSAPWGSKVYSSLFPSAQFVKRSEYLRNTEMVAKCKRGKFRLVRVENVFITRPDLTTTPPPLPLVVPHSATMEPFTLALRIADWALWERLAPGHIASFSDCVAWFSLCPPYRIGPRWC